MQLMRVHTRVYVILILLGLLTLLVLQLAFSARRESQTFDEACHLFSGYSYWTRGDFGMNPEHPPLVKLLAAVPLLRLPLHTPMVQSRNFKQEEFLDGKEFLYRNNADLLLFRGRLAASFLTILLALLVFAWTQEMFGIGAAFLALILLIFDPNILANGVLVTTDMGAVCFLFAAVYTFYRYVKKQSVIRLVLVGITSGLALASKHSGIVIFPMLLLLAFADLVIEYRIEQKNESSVQKRPHIAKSATRLAIALVTISIASIAVLWSSYGFRYSARPSGLAMNPPSAQFTATLQRPMDRYVIGAFAHRHLLPEAYLMGLTDIRKNADFTPSYIFGKLYAHGKWFYFPAIILIKSTLGFLLLLLGASIACVWGQRIGWRKAVFLLIPPVLYFLVAVSSGLNRGIRHILPIYPFLIVFVAGVSWLFIQRFCRWSYVLFALVIVHVASSAHAFPTYLAYSNELWGGPANTYKYVTDSNDDWGQQLKGTAAYLKQKGITECWIAPYIGDFVDTGYFGVPCKPLPTITVLLAGPTSGVPNMIEGPVFISASLISGFEFSGIYPNPYQEFQRIRPTAMIDNGVFVYEGSFDVRRLVALNDAALAWRLAATKPQDAVAKAQAAVALSPQSALTHACLGDTLEASGKPAEARQAYQQALFIAQTVQPDFQRVWIPYLEAKVVQK